MTGRWLLLVGVASLGGCLGIEGTDVSTGQSGTEADGSSATLSDPTSDPTGLSDSAGSTMTGGESDTSPTTGNVTNGDTGAMSSGSSGEGGTEDGSDSTGIEPTETGTGSETGSETGSTETGSTGTDTGTETGDTCGDGQIQEPEACDGEDLGRMSCIDLQFGGGTLACDPETCLFDVSACVK